MKTRLLRFWVSIMALGLVAVPFRSFAPVPVHTNSGILGRAFLFQTYGSSSPYFVAPSVMLPASTTLTVYTPLGRKVGQVVSDADGMFELPLSPGKYVVVPEALPLGYFTSTANPIPVTVGYGKFTTVTVSYPWVSFFFGYGAIFADVTPVGF